MGGGRLGSGWVTRSNRSYDLLLRMVSLARNQRAFQHNTVPEEPRNPLRVPSAWSVFRSFSPLGVSPSSTTRPHFPNDSSVSCVSGFFGSKSSDEQSGLSHVYDIVCVCACVFGRVEPALGEKANPESMLRRSPES